MCPYCKIFLIEASSASFANLATAVNTAAALGARVISNSYGGGESGSQAYEAAYNHLGVAITHPSRVVYPGWGVTKREIAAQFGDIPAPSGVSAPSLHFKEYSYVAGPQLPVLGVEAVPPEAIDHAPRIPRMTPFSQRSRQSGMERFA